MANQDIEFRVANLDCEHDAAALERGLSGFPGLMAVKVYPKAAKVALDLRPRRHDAPSAAGKARRIGFSRPEEHDHGRTAQAVAES